jgi:hypothetical protein
MKKYTPAILALLLSYSLSAQYKKASFFEKEGRTYELGSQLYAFGDGKGSPIGFKIGFGRDRDGKQLFSSWELQFIPSYKYSFSTTDENNDPVQVNGDSRSQFIYAVNYNYHILKNDDEERIIKPFVSAGFNIVIASGAKGVNYTPESAYGLKKDIVDGSFTAGIGGGLGTLINFTPTLGLKLQGGYNYEFNIGNYDFEGKGYYMFTSHPYVSLSFRIRIVSDK